MILEKTKLIFHGLTSEEEMDRLQFTQQQTIQGKRRQSKSTPARASERAECFEYAEEHVCAKFIKLF